MSFEYDPRFPPEKQFSWYNVTTWADRDWDAARREFWRMLDAERQDPRKEGEAGRYLAAQRESYRSRVLSWYRKLCLPMQTDECVPTRVAELLAEELDEATA